MKKLLLIILIISFKTQAQSVELKPGSNGFVMIPNVSVLGTCVVADKGKIVYYSVDNSLRMCNGSSWINISSTSSLTLPFSSSANDAYSELFKITNTSTTDGIGISGYVNGVNSGIAVSGVANSNSPTSINVSGVYGASYSNNTNGVGVRGFHSGLGYAVFGNTVNGIAANFNSTNGFGLQTKGKLQFAGNGVGTIAANKFLKSINASGDAQWADILPLDFTKNESIKILSITNSNTGPATAITGTTLSFNGGIGVYGIADEYSPTNNTYGVYGFNHATNSFGSGVYGNHYGTGAGVLGESDGVGVKGISTVGKGVWGEGPEDGVRGSTTTGSGVTGTANGVNGFGGFFNSSNGPALATGFGNVGIGSVSPKYKLTFNSVLGDKISLWGGETSNTTNHYGLGIDAAKLQLFVPSISENFVFGTGRSGAFTEKVRITGGGNLGIGINIPNASLSVARGTGVDGTAALFGTLHTTHFNYSTNEDTYIRGGKPGSNVYINDVIGLGFVGIKNSNPTFTLDVSGRMRLRNESAGVSAGVWLDGTNQPKRSFIGTFDNNKMGLFGDTSGWSLLMDVISGNIGINTSTANSKLEVNGSMSLPIKTITISYTLTDDDYSVRMIGYQNAGVTIPSPVNKRGRIYVISADLPLLLQPPSGLSVFNPIYIYDHLGNNFLANSNLSGNDSGDYLYFYKFLNGKYIKKTSLTVQSTGSTWEIIDNDFQF